MMAQLEEAKLPELDEIFWAWRDGFKYPSMPSTNDLLEKTRECRERQLLALLQSHATLVKALSDLITDVQEWCDAVSADSSWDSWDSYYKQLKWKGLDNYRAALEAARKVGSDETT